MSAKRDGASQAYRQLQRACGRQSYTTATLRACIVLNVTAAHCTHKGRGKDGSAAAGCCGRAYALEKSNPGLDKECNAPGSEPRTDFTHHTLRASDTKTPEVSEISSPPRQHRCAPYTVYCSTPPQKQDSKGSHPFCVGYAAAGTGKRHLCYHGYNCE